MFSPVEFRRILGEWRLRMQRVKDILQPPSWSEQEWRQFSQALALMVRDHGRSWIIDPNVYWDLRWRLQDGAELVCQIEHIPGEKTSLVVAQNGGFATEVGSYTWLWAEFNMEGNFSRDPYWVEGTWKEALTTLLMPLERQASFMLAGRAETPDSLLLQEGARPNDQAHRALMPGLHEENEFNAHDEWKEEKTWETHHEESPAPSAEPEARTVAPVEVTPSVPEPEPQPEPTPEPAPAPVEVAEMEPPVPALIETPPELPPPPPTPASETPESFTIRWGTVYQLGWKDTDEIAYALIEKYPQEDPVKLTLPQLHQMVVDLENFRDDPAKASQSVLESIQMAWYEELG